MINAGSLSLRSKPIKLSFHEAVEMLKKYNFYDHNRHPKGNGPSHKYKEQTIQEDKIIVDDASQLMWQQGGSFKSMNYESAEKWLVELNNNGFAGFNDWRLPTLEEAMSLMEPEKKNGDLYIDPVFDARQRWIWTADKVKGEPRAWYVHFTYGSCYSYYLHRYRLYVRAVRSG